MKKHKSKYCIIGAGLSGLTTAYQLMMQGESDFVILEGRSQIGGRVHTRDGVDLGATWFQEYHTYLLEMLDVLKLRKFPQYQEGKNVLVYNTMAPAHYFESDPNAPAANRLAGGSIALIEALSENMQDKICINTQVLEIREEGANLIITTTEKCYSAEKVIVAIPPQLAGNISYSPEIPESVLKAMKQTHTWMSNSIKVGITYATPFWREKELSGTIIGQVGPVIELYDHNDYKDQKFRLMGFVNESLRDVSAALRKEKILEYIEKYFGKEAGNYLDYFEKDWSEDPFTSNENLKSLYMIPPYGNELFAKKYMSNKLLFSSSETSPVYGGYLEGAVYSGLRAASLILGN